MHHALFFFFFTFVCKSVLDILCASCEEKINFFFFLLQMSFVALFGGGGGSVRPLGTGPEGMETKGGNWTYPGATVCPVIIPHLSWLCFPHFGSWLFSDAPEGWIQGSRMEITHSLPGLFRDPRLGSGEAAHLPERMLAAEQWHMEK